MKLEKPLEDEYQEFKASLSQLEKGIDSLTAMLNKHKTGTIFFGVSNNGEIIGLSNQLGEETLKKISVKINELIKPSVMHEVSYLNFDDKRIIKVSADGNNRPYSSRGNYFIRMGTENKKIEPHILAELFYSSQAMSIEKIESYNQDLTFNQLKMMFANKGMTINNDNFYENMHFLTNGKFNYLANLLADNNDISIKVVRFEGLDKLKMRSRNEYGFQCIFTAMKQAKEYVASLNETRVDIESSLERKEYPLFDQHSFDEAWTNAILHNKWVKNVPPAIYIFDNRIEIISTGGLPFDYSKENFYKGVSNPVNPSLQRIMLQLGLVEQTGHGNLTIINKYGKEAFQLDDNYINVTIPFAFTPSMANYSESALLPNQIKVYNAIKTHPTMTIKDLSTLLNLGTTQIGTIIKELKSLDKIERIGSNKNGYWLIKN